MYARAVGNLGAGGWADYAHLITSQTHINMVYYQLTHSIVLVCTKKQMESLTGIKKTQVKIMHYFG